MTPRETIIFDTFRALKRAGTLLLLVALLLVFGVQDADAARKKRKSAPAPDRYGSIVIDAETGQVLAADRADRQLHPASLTKMMTLLLTFEALAEHRLRTGDYIRVSSRAAAAAPSKLGVPAGGTVQVDDAIGAVAIKSANDISVALAEALAGSEGRFVQRMNERAKSIGMTRTRFMNASGLPNPNQISTPRDMAILARYIITNYPQYYRYFGKRYFNYAGRSHPNHNKLMNTYSGMDGMKTGYVNASGYNLVASAKRGDRRLIGVVFGGRSATSRNQHMASLLDKGFQTRSKPVINVATLPSYPDAPRETSRPPVDLPTAGFALSTNSPAPINERMIGGIAMPPRKPGDTAAASEEMGSRDAGPDASGRAQLDGILGKLVDPAAGPQVASTGDVPSLGSSSWSIQIGAYQSRIATDQALDQALRILPADLSAANATVAPLKTTRDGWLFRARLGNLTEAQAKRACTYFRGCLMIAPQTF